MKSRFILTAALLAAAGLAQASPYGAPAAPPAPVAKVAKAPGPDARTVAEVFAGPAALKDKNVTIRGQVVKVTQAVMGKNWVHLQDGTGSADRRTHDLIVTTTDTTAVGDVVVATGTVRTNVDLGSGYSYAVLVADAKIRK